MSKKRRSRPSTQPSPSTSPAPDPSPSNLTPITIKKPSLLRRFWWLLVLILLLAAGIITFFYQRQQTAAAELAALETLPFARQDLTSTLELTGVVDASRKVQLFYSTPGKLTALNIAQGDSVKTGQVLATLDQTAISKELDLSLNNYMIERLQFDDFEEQFKTRAATDDENLTSQLNQLGLENSVLAVEITSIAAANAHLTSPIDGIATTVPDIVPPMNILATDIFTIVDPQTLIFRTLIDELDLDLISLGQPALITFDALDDLVIETTISDIALASTVSNSGTAFEVEFTLPGANLDQLRLGMNGDANVILQQKFQVGAVPLEALFISDGGEYVRILDPDSQQIQEIAVTTGLETDSAIEITSGLAPGDLVIIN